MILYDAEYDRKKAILKMTMKILFDILSQENYIKARFKTQAIENLDEYYKFHHESRHDIDNYNEFHYEATTMIIIGMLRFKNNMVNDKVGMLSFQ